MHMGQVFLAGLGRMTRVVIGRISAICIKFR